MESTQNVAANPPRPLTSRWVSGTVVGIALASLFGDVSYEMAIAVLPAFLGSIGLGAAVLGLMEGIADFAKSISQFMGGYIGHRIERKRRPVAASYLVTSGCTTALAFTASPVALIVLRAAGWIAKGFRSPNKDFLMSDAVPKQYYGRAFGLERAGDMIGAVGGPLLAFGMLALAFSYQHIFVWSLIPGSLAAASIWFFVRERPRLSDAPAVPRPSLREMPSGFWPLLGAIGVFGLGDFSRTLLILVAVKWTGTEHEPGLWVISMPVLLYALHNAISALTTFPAGMLSDSWNKRSVLVIGYALGALTNLLLAFTGHTVPMLVAIFVMSGVYIAIEETVEKAMVAEILPREIRTYGLGLLATVNAVGDMLGSFSVGILWQWVGFEVAFAVAAACSVAGTLLLVGVGRRSAAGQ